MCILLNVKKHEKTFALNVDIFNKKFRKSLTLTFYPAIIAFVKVSYAFP